MHGGVEKAGNRRLPGRCSMSLINRTASRNYKHTGKYEFLVVPVVPVVPITEPLSP